MTQGYPHAPLVGSPRVDLPFPIVVPLRRLASLVQQSFFARPVRRVARELVGKLLVREDVVLRITEVEAYAGPRDTASHARSGATARNRPMWGPPGRVYMYLCYGLHHMLNIVCEDEGRGAAVLIRSCEPVDGLSTIQARRGGKSGPVLLTGPGKIGQALDLDLAWNDHVLYHRGGLELRDDGEAPRVVRGPRVGIDFASPRDRDALLRFAVDDSRWVSHRKTLGRGNR